jgi:Sulfotransferase family
VRSNRAFGVRRAVWRVRRSVPRVARPLSRVLPAPAAPERPVLVIGCPRSGTTMLLQGLLRGGALRSVQSEGHILWDEFHDIEQRGWDSDGLGADDLTEREREYVYTAIRLFARGRRFVDKTPPNCLRIPYLDALFPDAVYVFLRRRAADNVNSLIEAWRARPRFVKYRLPEPLTGLGELSGDRWSLTLVPGWRELTESPLEVICARQYTGCNEAVLDARRAISPERWHDVSYEDLVARPVAVLEALYERLELPFTAEAARHAAGLGGSLARTTLTAPRPDKWREQNPEAVERILPLVAATERRLGYAGG